MKSEPHPESPASMLSVEQELLPCPFCGSDADVEHLEDGRWSAGCVDPDGDCMGFQSLQTFPRKIVAINAWNTRHQSLSRSAGGANPPTIDAPERREAVANLIRDYLEQGQTWRDDDGLVQGEYSLADAILTLLAASSGEREKVLEEAARVAECAFDDRPNSRSGHHSEMDWTDGYRDGTRAASQAIRALAPTPATVEEPKV